MTRSTSPVPRWHNLSLLEHLNRVRAPWHPLVRRIVQQTLTRFLNEAPNRLVEIGAGGGQLRDWLPWPLRSRTIHAEPSEPFRRAMQARDPQAQVSDAKAECLPQSDGTVDAVLGLCVLDSVSDLAAVRDELHRVLRPGGVVVHFLDLSTNPDAAFVDWSLGGEIPLPNFVRDPGLRPTLRPEQLALLPEADDFDEVIAVPEGNFRAFLDVVKNSHPGLIAELGPYGRLPPVGQLDPLRLSQDFMAVRGDPSRLKTVHRALLTLTFLARSLSRAWPLRAFSLRTHLRERLRKAFGEQSGFQVEQAGPIWASEPLPSEVALRTGTRLLIRHAGRTASYPELVAGLGTPLAPEESAISATARTRLRLTSVEVFVARKRG